MTVGLVCLPVLLNQFRLEMARWHLAVAVNTLEGMGETPIEQSLDNASAWVDDLSTLRDYWLLRVKTALKNDSEQVTEEVLLALQADPKNEPLVAFAAVKLEEQQDWYSAATLLEAGIRKSDQDKPEFLNRTAYYRSLAVRDLDQALEDINRALEQSPEEPAYRDTRAWVLFQMGNPIDALEDANFAVEKTSELGELDWLSQSLENLDRWLSRSRADDEEPKTLTRREAGDYLWAMGALRYHRIEILRALGREDEAQDDVQWLIDNNLPQDDQLM